VRRADLASWSLGTFHACVLAIALLVVVYRLGGLDDALAGLSTAHGFALFLGLWAATVFTTTRALEAYRRSPAAPGGDLGPLVPSALRWGALNGVLFLWYLAVTQLVAVLASRPRLETLMLVPAAMPFLSIASLVAFVVGALVGLVFGTIDVQLLRLARSVAGASGVEVTRT